MSKIKKILVLGSGALKIGEAGEFDYSGSQAIKALKEEGIKTVLVNPNIATIQTSKTLADTVYFLPVNDFFVEKIIEKEKPDGILLSFGGQTALNCGIKLYKKGVLKKHGVEILGTPISAIILSEDRKKFAQVMRKIGVNTPTSKTAKNTRQAIRIAKEIGYPVMIRSAFALGGQGSGIAQNEKQLKGITEIAFSFVTQVLIEQYLHHFKEVEYEVVRDTDDNCIAVCNMENMDPLGIHTGESIVIAPSQTLTNFEYHTLRAIAIKIVRSLKIVGECNVQFALNPNPNSVRGDSPGRASRQRATPQLAGRALAGGKGEAGPRRNQKRQDPEHTLDYFVIELNARLSRSSALASKATGCPLAYVAAKLALGKNLTELQNKVTLATQFCFEPALDYVTIKLPRWDINKFKNAESTIGSSMKSVGEVMGIGRTFEEAFQKAIRMLDLNFEGAVNEAYVHKDISSLKAFLKNPTPNRMFEISEGFKKNISVEEIYKLTGIDPWFLYRIKNIVEQEQRLETQPLRLQAKLLTLKQLGFSDKRIGYLVGKTGLEIRALRKKLGILPSVFQIDTLAGEFPAQTNYLYLTYNGSHHDIKPSNKNGVIVLGSGPYRIGSSVEFDWCCVNTVLSLSKHNKQSIVVNCNPETVSTDYDISDKLYFEELTFERVADIYDFENPYGVIVSVGGQTPNNRAKSLKAYGAKVLGTDPDDIDRAEDRSKFSALLDKLNISQPPWDKFSTIEGTVSFSRKVGFPVLIRPSYVLSGTYMKICHTKDELGSYLSEASLISSDYPVTVSKFIENAKEIEADCVAKEGTIRAFVITEHIENAGVHSGDASIVLPPQTINKQTRLRIEQIAKNAAKALFITGPFNIQCLVKGNEVSVIEMNLRSSRTFPFVSKVTGVNFIELAVDCLFENEHRPKKTKQKKPVILSKAKDLGFVAVKVAQFSFARLSGADPVLDVEMTSTGEVACFGEDLEEAFLKAELSVGGTIPKKGIFVTLGGDENKESFLESARLLRKLSIPIFATEKTALFLNQEGIKARHVYKIHEKKSPNCLEIFQKGMVDLAINIVDMDIKKEIHDDYIVRRTAVDHNIPLFTNLQKAELFIKAIASKRPQDLLIKSWNEYRFSPGVAINPPRRWKRSYTSVLRKKQMNLL